MRSLKGWIDKIKGVAALAKTEEQTEVNDVAYLKQCIYNFGTQTATLDSCAQFLSYLDNFPPNTPVDEVLINECNQLMKEVIENELDNFTSESGFASHALKYSNYATARKEPDGSYTICPVITHDKLIELVQDFFLSSQSGNIVDVLMSANEATYKELLHSKINTYYGDMTFIIERCKAITDAIEMISLNYQLLPDELQLFEVKASEARLLRDRIYGVGNVTDKRNRHNKPIYNLTQDDYYDIVSPSFAQLLQIEKELSVISQRIWSEYFQNRGAKFVHALSGQIVESDKMFKICSSLFLGDLATIPYGHTGYEYGVSMDNIECICEEDVGSWTFNKPRFLEGGIAHSWQWNEETNMFYEYGYFSKLLPPDYIERKSKENNKPIDSKYICYTEILILNRQPKVPPLKAFYTSEATPEEIAQITDMAKRQGIDVEYIDTKAIREVMTKVSY